MIDPENIQPCQRKQIKDNKQFESNNISNSQTKQKVKIPFYKQVRLKAQFPYTLSIKLMRRSKPFIESPTFLRRNLLYKIILKTTLIYIMDHQSECSKIISIIGKLQNLNFFIYHNNKPIKDDQDMDFQCFFCRQNIYNKFLMILHYELFHPDNFFVRQYQIDKMKLKIFVVDPKQNRQDFVEHDEEGQYYLIRSPQGERMKSILDGIFNKFIEKKRERKRKYYHSYDIFKVVGSDSEDEDSQNQAYHLEQDFQRCRITELVDVKNNEKKILKYWNQLVFKQKLTKTIFDNSTIDLLMKKFVLICKERGITRKGLYAHCFNLWSHEKITKEDLLTYFQIYDNCSTRPISPQVKMMPDQCKR